VFGRDRTINLNRKGEACKTASPSSFSRFIRLMLTFDS
jgi:hypothetical protein